MYTTETILHTHRLDSLYTQHRPMRSSWMVNCQRARNESKTKELCEKGINYVPK